MRHEARLLGARGVDQELREERSAERRGEWIAVFVERPRLQRGPDEVAHEDLARVLHDRLSRAARDRLALHGVEVAGRAEIPGARDDLEAELLAQPRDRDARVQPAGVREHAGLAGVWPRHRVSLRAMPNVVK
jgi:hypothetical protein